MRRALLVLTLGAALHAGPVLDASGTGTYYYGEGMDSPIWQFNVAGVSCEMAGGYLCGGDTMGIFIDGSLFDPGYFSVSLHPEAGMQDFVVTGSENGVTLSEDFQTFGTMTSNSCTPFATGYGMNSAGAIVETVTIPTYMCSEVFSFSAVGPVPSPISETPLSETGGIAPAAVPEPSTWLLVLAGVALAAIPLRRRTLPLIQPKH